MRFMVSNVDLLPAGRHGIAIDYCPKCKGLWPNWGEINKIIEQEGERQ